jgi:signal transduction histidine kinase
MRYSAGLLGEFRGVGNPLALAAAIAIVGIAFFGEIGVAWGARTVQLLATYFIAFLGLALARAFMPWPQRFVVPLLLAIATVCAAALWPAIGLHRASAAINSPLSLAFDYGLGVVFAGALILPGIFTRRGEEARRHAEHERHARELEQETHLKQLAEMRLKALQAQIEPHFLFNTLANVQHLLRTSPPEADLMLESLIRYLKSAVPQMRSAISTVGEELARIEAYLAIMRVRMGERLRYEIAVPAEANGEPLPPLSLMTLVENAVKHGIEPRAAGGAIRIEGLIEREALVLRVIDDGVGFTSELGAGIGLTNLRDRLAAIHGGTATLELARREPSGVDATLRIPMTRAEAHG